MRFLPLISSLCLTGLPVLAGCTSEEPQDVGDQIEADAENALDAAGDANMTADLGTGDELDLETDKQAEGIDINNVGE